VLDSGDPHERIVSYFWRVWEQTAFWGTRGWFVGHSYKVFAAIKVARTLCLTTDNAFNGIKCLREDSGFRV